MARNTVMFDEGNQEDVVLRSLLNIVEAVTTKPALLKEFDAMFTFAIKPNEFVLGKTPADATSDVYKTFVLDLRTKSKAKERLTTTANKDSQLTFAIHEKDWNDILTPPAVPEPGYTGGTLDPIAAFMCGLMWLEGDVALAMKLPNLVNLARKMEIRKSNT